MWQGKSKKTKSDECFICGRRGHGQKDCWYKDTKGNKGKGKFKGKGKQKGKGKDKNNPVTEVRQDDSQSLNGSQKVANVTTDWIFAVTWADNWEKTHESEVEILLDSGAYVHVCIPEEFAIHSPLLPRWDTGVVRNGRWQQNTNSRTKAGSLSTGEWTDCFGRLPSHEREASLSRTSELTSRNRSSQDQMDDRHEYTDRVDFTTCEHNFSNQSNQRR